MKFYNVRISAPKGINPSWANLKCCKPNGIPTMVRQNIRPITRWPRANSQPNTSSQIILSINPPAPKLPKIIARPNGHSTNPAILKHCKPNGMPMTVIHKIKPANDQAIAPINPPKITQIILPINLILLTPFRKDLAWKTAKYMYCREDDLECVSGLFWYHDYCSELFLSVWRKILGVIFGFRPLIRFDKKGGPAFTKHVSLLVKKGSFSNDYVLTGINNPAFGMNYHTGRNWSKVVYVQFQGYRYPP